MVDEPFADADICSIKHTDFGGIERLASAVSAAPKWTMGL